MLHLGVNIDHVATVRQARRTEFPDLMAAAALCERGGAHGITIHLREDRRHIQDADVYALRRSLTTRMNLEMAHHPDIVAIALEVRPEEVCLVPERREELTTEGGLDVVGNYETLAPVVEVLSDAGIIVSMFIDPDIQQVEATARIGASTFELHTGIYVNRSGTARELELARLNEAARRGRELGLRINAGHGLTLQNVEPILRLPNLDTLNIGHSIVARALFVGLEEATREMIARMQAGMQ